MVQYTWPNVQKTLKTEIHTLQTELQNLLTSNLLGIYLHGSLAQGGFQPARSDINIVAVLDQQSDQALTREIIKLLLRVSKAPSPLDIYFLIKQDIFPFRQPLPFELHYDERQRENYLTALRNENWHNDLDQHEPNLSIDLTILHRYGIVLAGQPIAETLPLVPESVFRDTLITAMQSAQAKRLHDLVSFVLNACRTIAYLQTGKILSKDEGGVWGEAHLPEKYHPLLHQSLALYRGDRLSRPAGRALLDDFASYIESEITSGHSPS